MSKENANHWDDIFLWANKVDAHKDAIKIDLFLFTKGYTVYSTAYDPAIKAQLKVLFLYDMISEVQMGAATGMAVREFGTNDREDGVLQYVPFEQVPHCQEVVEQIAYGEEGLELFREGDHELKKVKGIVARFTMDGMEPFYVVKVLPNSQVMKGNISWSFSEDGRFSPMKAAAAIRVTPDNQILVAGPSVFAFSESKFVKAFGYDPGIDKAVTDKIAEIEKHFKLKYPEGVDMRVLLEGSKSLADKLLRCNPDAVSQDQLLEQAEDFDLALMTDDAEGSIIIMDKRDAGVFINLLNDDYVDSSMTGVHYLAAKKKQVVPVEDSQMGMGI